MNSLRKITPLILLSLALPHLVFGLKVGDDVTPEAIGKAKFLQGAAPAQWEKGKLYVLECWATWCPPCLKAIPHVDALYDKFKEKGLVVIGMNVWEEGEEMITKFVQDKGAGMSYPVAYVGKGGAFEEAWLKAAGVSGIPHAFVVKDGKLLFTTHPMNLTEEMVEALLKGGEEAESILSRMGKSDEIEGHMAAFSQAMQQGDSAGMEKAMAEVRKLNPEAPMLGGMTMALALQQKDWAGVKTALQTNPAAEDLVGNLIPAIDSEDNVSPELLNLMLEKIQKLKERDGAPGLVKMQTARLYVKLGNKEKAIEAAQVGLKEIEANGRFPLEPFKAFLKSIEDDKAQTFMELIMAVRGAVMKQQQQPTEG